MPEPSHRDRFLVPGPGPYLLTHSVGCLPRESHAALLREYLDTWAQQGGDAWPHWLGQIDGFRQALARVLGGEAAHFCPQVNLSSALSKLLGALPAPAGTRRVWLAHPEAFPSLGFVLARARRLGYELRLLDQARDPSDPATWEAAISGDVCAVLATHVHSNTGVVTPVEAIARLCAERDVFCVVDVAQSAGILPLRVDSLGADAVIGSCIKWLCGGPGAGFLHVGARRLAALEPIDVGWFSHADPFEFDIRHFVPAPDARRFWGGTPDVAPFLLAARSLHLLGEIGVAHVLEHCRSLQRIFIDGLPPRWRARLSTRPTRGTLCIPLGADFDAVTAALRRIGARFDTRGDVLRLSFHLCNEAEDADGVARAFTMATTP